jgi:glycosyltransferase involved in cell wall biosynthesis
MPVETGSTRVRLSDKAPSQDRIRVVLYQSRMHGGGAQRVTLIMLNNLDRKRFLPILVLRQEGGELEEYIPADVPVYYLRSRVRSAWFRLARLLPKLAPDVTLSMSTMGNLTACLGHFVGRLTSPLLVAEHNTLSQAWGASRARLKWISFQKNLLYRRAHQVIAVSRGVADDLIAHARIPSKKVRVIYNPVVAKGFYQRASAEVDHPWFHDGSRVILAASRIVPQKDFPMLLEGFRQLRAERSARLLILGDGELGKPMEKLAQELGISDDVDFLGFVVDAPAYMKRCTVFALSSRYEGLPVALIEAMACGVPVVSTDCPSGPAEIITHGRDGLLVPVGDSVAMAGALKLLLDTPELRERLGVAGQKRASHFTVENLLPQYEELLNRAAGRLRYQRVP